MIMRQKRDLAENVWYGVETAVNVGEPLFRLDWTTVLFYRVLIEAKGRFPFEMRGLVLSGALLSFYIKPADGYQLPKITRWMKQTFSCRFNVKTGRTGGDASIQRGGFYAAAPWHIFQATPSMFRAQCWVGHVWGDRYKSEILVGESPPGVESVDWGPAVMLLSSAAGSMPPHRGAVFKQRPKHNKRLCLFRALSLVDGDACIQRGGSMPPHRGAVFKQRPHRFGRGIRWGGGDGQEEYPGGKDLRTCLGQPPPGGRDGKGPFFVRSSKRPPFPPIHPADPPQPPRNGVIDSLGALGQNRPQGRSASYHSAGFWNRL
jgi:hypothetical protein